MSKESYQNPVITFVIPTHNQQPDKICDEIDSNFPNHKYHLLIVNDGSTITIKSPKDSTVINHKQKLGLARSLVDGYKEATRQNPLGLVAKVDVDGEYPISSIRDIIADLTENKIGGVVGLKRSVQSSGIVDWVFNKVMGNIEGEFLIGKPLIQHSPGLQIYKASVMELILPNLERITEKLDLKWGLDIATIKYAVKYGDIICIEISDHSWRQRRPLKKIYYQAVSAVKVMNELKNGKT